MFRTFLIYLYLYPFRVVGQSLQCLDDTELKSNLFAATIAAEYNFVFDSHCYDLLAECTIYNAQSGWYNSLSNLPNVSN